MGRLRRIARQFADGVSRRVGRDELFEQPGERAAQAPLARTPAPSAAPSAAPVGPPADAPSGDPTCTLSDLDGVVAALGPGGGIRLVNHWATWCLGCVDEFDELKSLVRQLDGRARVLGVSWDLFDPRGDEEDIREQVENFGAGHDLTWPTMLLDSSVRPPDFFAALSLEFDQIPQTWLVADDGTVLHRVNGVLDAAATAAVIAALGAAV